MSEKLSLKIEGMHCDGCVRRVTAALKNVEGVTVDKVEVGSALVEYNGDPASRVRIAEAVSKIGFQATPIDQ